MRRPWWRRAAGALARGAARVAVRVFFREVRVEEMDRMRAARGARLVVAHHLNSLVDPLLIFAFVPGPPRFLAKSTLWRHPVVAPLVILFDALPVYRHQDGVDVSKNADTFVHAREILCRGGTVALFPEGRSHSEPRPLPLKTGAARIALHACEEGAPGLAIVPVGIVYEDKGRFRSRVALRFGEPIDPAPEAAAYPVTGRAAVRALTDRIAAGLEEATPRGMVWPSPPARLGRAAAILLAPAALAGTILNWLPYQMPGWAARALTRNPDEPATYKILTALLAFPVVWTFEAAAAAFAWGPRAGALVALLAPATGYVALLFHDMWSDRAPRGSGPAAGGGG
jgi:1-acyl-sn-glycerol-3-phosphate acyltransferase